MKNPSNFKFFFQHVTDYFKTPQDWLHDFQVALKCCEKENIDEFEEHYSFSNPKQEVAKFIQTACFHGQIFMLQHLMKKNEIKNDSTINWHDSFVSAVKNNHLSIVRYMLSKDFPQKIDMYADNESAIKYVFLNQNENVRDFFLYNKNYQLSDNLKKYLEQNGNDIIHFNKRDIILKLEEMRNPMNKNILIKKI